MSYNLVSNASDERYFAESYLWPLQDRRCRQLDGELSRA